MRARERVSRITGGWRGDALVALGLTVFLLAVLSVKGLLHGANNLLETSCAAGVFGSVIVRRVHPQLAAVAAACCLAVAGVGSSAAMPGSLILVPAFMLAYSLGTSADLARSALVMLFLGAGLQLSNGLTQFNPIILVVTVGSWAVGLVVRSRRQLTDQLAARGLELEAERELLAAEKVRYERARIARELHDVVAHCVSVMVIQASAGRRLTGTDPAQAAEAFDSIGEVARQAAAELGRLVDVLDHDTRPGHTDSFRLIGELVAQAAAAGLAVSCRFTGSADSLRATTSDAAYRVVQESLTNAFKHAPGAPVDIVIVGTSEHVEIGVINGPATGPPSGLEQAGGGHGLTGIRERAAACGGQVSAGPVAGGGWQVLTLLPHQPAQARLPSPG